MSTVRLENRRQYRADIVTTALLVERLTATARAMEPPSSPIIVRMVDQEPTRGLSFADVLLRSMSLAGALLAASIVLGLVFGGIFIWVRVARSRHHEATVDGLKLTPPVK